MATPAARRQRCPRGVVIGVALVLAVAGCASVPRGDAVPAGTADPLALRCERAFAALDAAVAAAGTGDAMAARVPGFAWLRVDRFTASFREAPMEAPAFEHWVAAMQRLDREARLVEIANLPVAPTREVRATLAREGLADLAPAALLEGCAATLRDRDLGADAGRTRLRTAAVVPDAYADWMRVAGAYPLAAIPFSAGVRRYEDATRDAFAMPLEAVPVQGMLRAYAPRATTPRRPDGAAAIVTGARRDPQGVPAFSPEDADRLLVAWAPVFVVDERDGDDRIGRPKWTDGLPTVDAAAPVVFTRIAFTRFGGDVLVQLVYTAWFPARPPTAAGDPLAGRLDGIVWRVTLDRDGAPLAFDSIHPCGCYHAFFPTARLALRPSPPTIDEGALVPQMLPDLPMGARIALRVDSGTHYLRRVIVAAPEPADAVRYGLAAEDTLRSLPLAEGARRSLYGPDGLVPGTERSERLLFWPMGISSAGAMRQWGNHATAFVGRRHFDEPFLIDRYFERRMVLP